MSYKSNKIKKKLESLGHKDIVVEWIPLSGPVDMGGYDGGWFASSNELSYEPLGYSVEEALETLESEYYDLTDVEPVMESAE